MWTDRAKMEEWGLGAANLGRKVRANACESVERMKVVLAMQSAALNEDALLLCDNEAVLCVIRKWVGLS